MSTDETKTYVMESALKSVINVLEDGQKGMAVIGDRLKDERLKVFFLAESLKRANFRGELENELHRQGVADVHENGTAAGVVYRAWAELKADMGGGDHTLLVTAEQEEDAAVDVYQDALNRELPEPIREMLIEQQAQVQQSHDYVRDQLEASLAKK
jgi:uncharacterized protein (TIGR02284 family)